LKHFTGIDSPYEPPEHPEIRVNTVETTAEEAADTIVTYVLRTSLGEQTGRGDYDI
jgi:bifunctional enzyme CysN/CysC